MNISSNDLGRAFHVYIAQISEQDCVLLDVRQPNEEACYVLLQGGALLWPAIERHATLANIVTSLTASFPTWPPETLEKHVRETLDAYLERGWLSTTPTSQETPRQTSLPAHRFFGLYYEAQALLKRCATAISQGQFMALIQGLMELPTNRDPHREDHNVTRILEAVRQATYGLPHLDLSCLHQSLVMCWMLRSRGYHAQVEIRIQTAPLGGHMIVVNEDQVLSWRPGLVAITSFEHFLASTVPIFHSGRLDTHYWTKELDHVR